VDATAQLELICQVTTLLYLGIVVLVPAQPSTLCWSFLEHIKGM
jgi:hypothetical protein